MDETTKEYPILRLLILVAAAIFERESERELVIDAKDGAQRDMCRKVGFHEEFKGSNTFLLAKSNGQIPVSLLDAIAKERLLANLAPGPILPPSCRQ